MPRGATWDLNGTAQSVCALSDGTAGGGSVVNSAAGTISALTLSPTASTTFSGSIQGSVSLAVSGAGTQALAGNNTYTGGTTINFGILEFTRTASLPGYSASGSVTVGAAGVLAVQANTNGTTGWNSAQIDSLVAKTTWSSAIAGLGIDTAQGNFTYGSNLPQALLLTKLGPNQLTLTGSNTYTGQTTISGGTLQLGDGVAGHDVALTGGIVNNAALVYNLNGSQTYAGSVSGTGNVTKTGPGTLTFVSPNTYAGTTSIKQGTLQMNPAVVAGVTLPGNFAANGTAVNGFQDFFTADSSLNPGWTADSGINVSLPGGGFPMTLSGYSLDSNNYDWRIWCTVWAKRLIRPT